MLGITPLIDIVFLLLIFFMLTSHFHVASGVPIRLPKVAQKAHKENRFEVILAVDRSGLTYLNGDKIDLKALNTKLKELVAKEGQINLILQADKDVKHGKVVEIMDMAKIAGIPSVIIAAQWHPQKEF